MTAKFFLGSILCLTLCGALRADVMEGNYNVTGVCTTVKAGTKLGSIQSCARYYECTNKGPVLQTCNSGYSFDLANKKCAPAAQVNCFYDIEFPCNGKVGTTWVPNKDICGGWIYCVDGNQKGKGSCNTGQVFLNGKCEWGDCNEETTELSLLSLCEVVPPGIYFGSTNDCAVWYTCDRAGNLKDGTCSSNKQTAFDVSIGSCNYPSDAICSRVYDDNSNPSGETCTAPGETKPDNKVCGTYYECVGTEFVQKTCGIGNYYDTDSEECVPRQAATPVDTCNRCQYTPSQPNTAHFVNAVDPTCKSYYYCNSNGEISIVKCNTDYYFNEDKQACRQESSLDTYRLTNGACAPNDAEGPNEEPESPEAPDSPEAPESPETGDDGDDTTD